MNRRKFLEQASKYTMGMGAIPLIPRLIASPLLAQSSTSGYRALVCVFLLGGNDGNNTLIPSDNYYSQYASVRGGLAISQSDLNLLSSSGANRAFGLHPSLANVASLYNQGNAAILANAGPMYAPYSKTNTASLPSNLFSHSDQVNDWQSSIVQNPAPTGWAGRISDIVALKSGAISPVAISTAGWSLLGTGASTQLASVGNGNNAVAALTGLQALSPSLTKMESNADTNALINDISHMRSSFLSSTSLLLNAASNGSGFRTAFPASAIGQQLKVVAELINGRSVFDVNQQIFFSSAGGYDTHVNQVSYQASNLTDLDNAISAFSQAMQEIGMFNQVTLFTMTDFARSFLPNSTAGTDHAWGNHHLVVGGAVKGGRLYGQFPDLQLGGDSDFGTTGLWIPTTSGTQYAATLSRWLGVGQADVNSIFTELGNFPAGTLGFL